MSMEESGRVDDEADLRKSKFDGGVLHRQIQESCM